MYRAFQAHLGAQAFVKVHQPIYLAKHQSHHDIMQPSQLQCSGSHSGCTSRTQSRCTLSRRLGQRSATASSLGTKPIQNHVDMHVGKVHSLAARGICCSSQVSQVHPSNMYVEMISSDQNI